MARTQTKGLENEKCCSKVTVVTKSCEMWKRGLANGLGGRWRGM